MLHGRLISHCRETIYFGPQWAVLWEKFSHWIQWKVSPQLSQNPEILQEVERQGPSPSKYGLHRKMYHLADSDINVCFPISLTPLTRCSVTENQINTPGGFVIKEIQARFDYCWQESRVYGANSNPILRTNILADSMALSQSILNWETGV